MMIHVATLVRVAAPTTNWYRLDWRAAWQAAGLSQPTDFTLVVVNHQQREDANA